MLYRTFFFTFLLSVSLVACGVNTTDTNPNSQAETTTDTDLNPETEAEKVVALTSLTADIIYRLDATKLVGIPGSRLLKEDERFTDFPTMNEGRTPPDLEKIVALEPDLVIGAEGFSDQTLSKLEELGIKTIATNIDSWTSLKEVTKTLASAIGSDPEPLLKEYDTYLPDKTNEKSNLSTLVLVSRQPILAPNKNSWAGDLLSAFPVKNVAAQLQGSSPVGGYVTLSPEKILESNPDTLIIVDPSREGILEQLKQEAFWKNLKATQQDQVYVFDYYGLVNPGSLEKIKTASQQLEATFN
ncbi:MAG: ABC transporter substrate-binding protein [Cyanobacteria bacterium]|jgi:iron complex transport system substrate-binding protein|nr:ABC transporter substrate-binding protein [Cyanobacteria bacterium GSL.Bin1]